MSLIHDALKSMDAPQSNAPTPAPAVRAPVVAAPRGRPAWLDGLLAFCVVVGAGVAGWYVWQGQRHPRLDPAPGVQLAKSVTPPAVPAIDTPAQPVAAPAAVAAGVPSAETAPPAASMPVVAAPATPVAMPAAPSNAPVQVAAAKGSAEPHAAAPRRGSAAPHRRYKERPHAVAAKAEPKPPVDDTPVEAHFARFVTAMRAENTADAERELQALKARLPAYSLGLVRAQAWFDLKSGRDAAAAHGYRAILDRMPGDEEAAINLASIQSRQLRHEAARATLDAAARLHPDSAALRTALAQYTPNAHK